MHDNLKDLTTPELWERFLAAAARTADGLREMAECWVELQSRGEDLTPFSNPMLRFLPDVAHGRLLPEVLLRYGGSPPIVEAILGLIEEDQRKLVTRDPRFPILQTDGAVRHARPSDLRIPELRQVFGDGRIRTIAEQRPHLAPTPRSTTSTEGGGRSGFTAMASLPSGLTAELAPNQLRALAAAAKKAAITPLALLVRWAVRHGELPDRPVPVTPETRRALRGALSRPRAKGEGAPGLSRSQ